jgi:hypothetical protein
MPLTLRPSRRDLLAGSVATAATLALSRSPAQALTDSPRVAMGKVSHVNTTDVRSAIELGCRTMQSVFNADDLDRPFFASKVYPSAELSFSAYHSEAHVPGRHLLALLAANEAVGIHVDEAAIEKHRQTALFSYSGPLPLPLNRQEITGPLVNFLPHNIREGFHALYALVKYRNDPQARELAERSIAAIFKLWDPQRGWDKAQIEGHAPVQLCYDDGFFSGLARAIGPLVKYHRATGYGAALKLATLLKDKAIAEAFLPDGAYRAEAMGEHGHSITCVMSSLAQFADSTHDAALIERVRAFYDNGLCELRDSIGWSIEMTNRNPDRGEVNNSGDIVETALILGRWGHAKYFADAERIIRGHILPSQLRDISFIAQPPNPQNKDGLRDVANRHLGAFGFPAPYGHCPLEMTKSISFNMDIVGGTVASLCEVIREAVRSDDRGHWVNLLLDQQTDSLSVQSPYPTGELRITLNRAAPLHVRIPPWVDRNHLEVPFATRPLKFENDYLVLSDVPPGRPISLSFDLAQQEILLKHRTRDIRARLRGDEVFAMDNFGTKLTFFDPMD